MIDDADGYICRVSSLRGAQNQILTDYHTLRHGDIQIQMALKEINIELIYANSSQAKGRIEILFRIGS